MRNNGTGDGDMSASMTTIITDGVAIGVEQGDEAECIPPVRETQIVVKKRGDLYEVSVGGDRSEEVMCSIVKAVLGCGTVWSFDGTISLGSAR